MGGGLSRGELENSSVLLSAAESHRCRFYLFSKDIMSLSDATCMCALQMFPWGIYTGISKSIK